jgi:multiple sugar transport system permease protein
MDTLQPAAPKSLPDAADVRQRQKHKRFIKNPRFVFTQVSLSVALLFYAVLSIYPFLWMISSALKSNKEVLTSQSLIPVELRFDILANTWAQLDFWRYMFNSTLVSTAVVGGVVLVYSLAGYGFAKTHFWGRDVLFVAFLSLLLVPGVTVLIPLVQLLKGLGFIGPSAGQISTYIGLVMPMINGAGPFAIFLFRNFFAALPNELGDAAKVDGCSDWGIYFRIYLPLSAPAIATVGVINLISTWNAYVWPSIVLNKPEWYTLPLKLRDMDLQIVIQWNVRMAGSLISIAPIILAFLLLQRYYIRGLTAGAVKA